jgi:hypothetical protein
MIKNLYIPGTKNPYYIEEEISNPVPPATPVPDELTINNDDFPILKQALGSAFTYPALFLGSLYGIFWIKNHMEGVSRVNGLIDFLSGLNERALAAGYTDLSRLDKDADMLYQTRMAKCDAMDDKILSHFRIQINCKLDAQLAHACALTLALGYCYLKSCKSKGVMISKFNSFSDLFHIREEYFLNGLLLKSYNELKWCLDFIYKDDQETFKRYMKFLDQSTMAYITDIDRQLPPARSNAPSITKQDQKFHEVRPLNATQRPQFNRSN